MAGPAFGTNVGQDFTFQANSDLSGGQWTFVQLAATGYLVQVSSAGQRALGIQQDTAKGTASIPVGSQIRTAGTSKVKCGGTFSAGDLLSSDSSGRAVKYTGATVFTGTPYSVSGSQVLGVAVESGAVNAISTMLFQPSGLVAAGD